MRKLALATIALLACGTTATANDYVRTDPADWYRYTDAASGQEVDAAIRYQTGGWSLWDQFGGLGPRWVYTTPSYDWVWMWAGAEGAQFLGDFASPYAYTANLDADNRGTFRVVSVGGTLQTPAGTFTNVSEVQLQTVSGDAGVSAMWLARDVGVVQWIQQSANGPQTFSLSAGNIAGQTYPQVTAPPPPPPPAGGSITSPPEYAPSETILWGANDTYLVLDTYIDSFTALDGQTPRVVSDVSVSSQTVGSQLQYELAQANVPMNDVQIFVVALDSVWMRDYGPLVFKDANGQRAVGDLEYYPGRFDDDAFPAAYAGFRGWPVVDVSVGYEGGNFISDGRGQAFASEGLRWFNQGLSDAQILAQMQKIGVSQIEYFQPLIDEGTTHIDMFAKTMSDTTAIVSDYPAGHRQKPIVDACATRLAQMGYTQIERITAHVAHDEYATYANSILANGLALIPGYGNAALDQAAVDAYTRLGYTSVLVDCRMLIQYGGAVHCISMQVPN